MQIIENNWHLGKLLTELRLLPDVFQFPVKEII